MSLQINSSQSKPGTSRVYWVSIINRLAEPVLSAAAEGRLRSDMPVRGGTNRGACTHLEAVGRLLNGMAPWLNCQGLEGEEAELQRRFTEIVEQHAVE